MKGVEEYNFMILSILQLSAPTLSLPQTLSRSLSFFLSFSLAHTHTHYLSHANTLSVPLTTSISLTRSHTLNLPIFSRDGWVDYLELSKRTDFNPSTTTFFWFLDKANLERSILEHSYKTIFNLRTR